MAKRRPQNDSLVLSTLAQIKALAEPLRYRVFELLTVEPRTAKQTAGLMGMKPTRLYHHFGVLEKAGLIRKVKTRKKRGTTEKYYEAVAQKVEIDPDILGTKAISLRSLRSALFQSTLEEILDVERAAVDAAQEPPVQLYRLKVRSTQAKIQELKDKIEELVEISQDASNSDGDTEYGLTVAFYQIAQNFSKEKTDES